MNFNHFFTNDEIEAQLKSWAEAHPTLAALSTLGKSHEQCPIWLLTLTNQNTGADTEKPAVWIDGNIHATEITGATAALYVADHLLGGYAQGDRRITRLLDTCTFYIVPRVNPDGAALAMAPSPRYVRSGTRPYPWDEKEPGLHEQDIDGDGRVLQMRIPDPHGPWKVSSLNPRLMEKRAPDEVGGDEVGSNDTGDGKIYYRLLTEGLVEDYDGYLLQTARPLEGLDFNRNFPFEWRPEGEQSGAGPFTASETEVHALAEFISRHPNINVALTFHTFSRALLRPFSTRADDTLETNDLWVYKKLGEIGTRLTGYRCVSTFHDFKYHPKEVTTGAFDDWMFDQFGAYTFTIELWDLPTEAGIKDRKFIEWWREHPHEEDVQVLKWVEEHAAPDGYVDWYPFDHPQLGRVELGGWNRMHTWSNPPQAFVEAEVSRHAPFVLSLAGMLPHLVLHTLKVTPLGKDQYHINLVVENTGFFSTTTSEQGKKRQAARPVRAELSLPEGVTIVNGKRRVELGHLQGRSGDLSVSAQFASDATSNRARAEWTLSAPPGATVTVSVLSERAGTIRKEIHLQG